MSLATIAGSVIILFGWPSLHRILGGDTVPPPRWTEADLSPLPEPDDNAWFLVPPKDELPRFDLDGELLEESPIPPDDLPSVDAAFDRPAVAELLRRASEVEAAPSLASPVPTLDRDSGDILKLEEWHRWVFVSVKRKAESDPAAAARELGQLIRKWTECANLARHELTYLVCGHQSKRALELALRLAPTVDDPDARDALAMAIRESGTPSPRNAIIAEHLRAHDGLATYQETGKRAWLRRTDFRRTWADIDESFARVLAGDECDERDTVSWGYNWGGRLFARLLTISVCVSYPHLKRITEEVDQLRHQTLAVLPSG